MPEFAKELAQKNPEQIAIRDDKAALTWDDVDGILNRAINRLLETDLGPQKRISVFAENSNETALAHLAGLLAGASTVPVNFHLTAEEAAYILDYSSTSLLFLGPESMELSHQLDFEIHQQGSASPLMLQHHLRQRLHL